MNRTMLAFPAKSRNRRALTLLELVMVVSILAVLTAMVVPGMNAQNEETRATVARKSMQDLRDTITNRYLVDMGDLPRAPIADTNRGATSLLPGYPQLHFLFVNPKQGYAGTGGVLYTSVNDYDPTTRIGWNGPYVGTTPAKYPNITDRRFPKDPSNTDTWTDSGFTSAYGLMNDQALNDPWGSPYVIRSVVKTGTVVSDYLASAGPNRVLESTWTFNPDGSLSSGDDLALWIRDRTQ